MEFCWKKKYQKMKKKIDYEEEIINENRGI
jgi:hypothetical protein